MLVSKKCTHTLQDRRAIARRSTVAPATVKQFRRRCVHAVLTGAFGLTGLTNREKLGGCVLVSGELYDVHKMSRADIYIYIYACQLDSPQLDSLIQLELLRRSPSRIRAQIGNLAGIDVLV